MNKLNVALPDWTKTKAIYIMAGVELVAYRLPEQKWRVKTSRCIMCGKCCMDLERHSWPTIDGRCVHLEKEPGKDNPRWRCRLAINRPFGCCVGTYEGVPGCTERYEVIQ